jgi:formylglycine-generating enzyme required for sulfatase activity
MLALAAVALLSLGGCVGWPFGSRPAPVETLPAEPVPPVVSSPTGGVAGAESTGQPMAGTEGRADARDRAGMVLVSAGAFWMGTNLEEAIGAVEECKEIGIAPAACAAVVEREMPRHLVMLDAYLIDAFEVTNGQFNRFVAATGYLTTAEREGAGWVSRWVEDEWRWTAVPGVSWRDPDGTGTPPPGDHPVLQVSWHDAEAYCQWAGKRLPTEAEWEKAARGGDGRPYPWGDTWDASLAGIGPAAHPRPVGAIQDGASPFEVHDMAGNAAEWVADWFDKDYYQTSPGSAPVGPASGHYRVVRGGSWNHSRFHLRTTYRGREAPDSRDNRVGFRCAAGFS